MFLLSPFLLATATVFGLFDQIHAAIAPAYDGKYHDVWYPIGKVKTPFAKTDGRLFNVNGKTQYITGVNSYWVPRLRNTSDVDIVMAQLASSGVKVLRTWAYATFNYTYPGPYESIYASWFQLINQTGTYVNYGETGLAQLDYVVHSAEKHGIFLVLPLVDCNSNTNSQGVPNLTEDLGGIDLYNNVYGCNATQWWTDTTCQNVYRTYVETIVTRYKSSPAIFAWEIMNEPRCVYADYSPCNPNIITKWASNVSAWVKTLDPKHMVTLGEEGWFTTKDGINDGTNDFPYNGAQGVDFVANIKIPTLDYDTVHVYYPGTGGKKRPVTWGSTFIEEHDQVGAQVNKPVVIEEYGSDANLTGIAGWQQTILQNTSIAMDSIWDFDAYTYEIGPCKIYCPVYRDSLSLFYGTDNYIQYVTNHTAAMAKKKV